MKETPTFTFGAQNLPDKEYHQWLIEIKQRFQQSQIKTAIKVNTALLEFYWSLGSDIVKMQTEKAWGSGFINQLSLDLREAFPEATGFSLSNIKYIRQSLGGITLKLYQNANLSLRLYSTSSRRSVIIGAGYN